MNEMITHSKPLIDNDDIKAVLNQMKFKQVSNGDTNKKLALLLSKEFKNVLLTGTGNQALLVALKILSKCKKKSFSTKLLLY